MKQYKRSMGPWGLMFSAVSAMIGSGWLFSSMLLTKAVGPIAILVWVLGGILILIVAFTYAELSTTLPVTGGSARFPRFTHGTFVSLTFAWITWINLMTTAPIEVQAMLQYTSTYWPSLVHQDTHGLTGRGMSLAALLMVFFCFLNAYSIKLVNRLNSVLTVWKIAVALITALVLIYYMIHAHQVHNFHNPKLGGFNPYGWNAVFMAISTGGVLFAFNGYKQVVELAGETENPRRNIIRALLGSLGIVMVIYILLQIGFIGALPISALTHGFSGVSFTGDAGPISGLLMALGFNIFAILLYSNAVVATGAAGIVYSTSAGRTLYAMSANSQLPKFLSKLSGRGIPVYAVLVNFVLGMTFFLPFKGWHQMIEFMSSVIALSYVSGPVCCLVARYQIPGAVRKFKLPFVTLWCFLAFLACACMVFWSGWAIISKLGGVLLVSLVLFGIYQLCSTRAQKISWDLRESIWLWVFLVGMMLIAYFSRMAGGGDPVLSNLTSYALVVALTAVSLFLAVKFRLAQEKSKAIFDLFLQEVETGKPADLSQAQNRA